MIVILAYLTSLALAFGGFISGLYALWYDSKNRERLRTCPTEYAALVLSTTLCLVYLILINTDSMNQENSVNWMLYHSTNKLTIFFFHVVLLTRVLRVRHGDRRVV